MEYTNFVSKYAQLGVWNGKEKLAEFAGMIGKKGMFSTNDPELVEKLKKHPDFGKGFNILSGTMPKFEDEFIKKGAATSSDSQQIEAIKKNLEAENELKLQVAKEELGQKFMRYGQLKQMLLKNDGTYRADATDELKAEYEQLKNEIGV